MSSDVAILDVAAILAGMHHTGADIGYEVESTSPLFDQSAATSSQSSSAPSSLADSFASQTSQSTQAMDSAELSGHLTGSASSLTSNTFELGGAPQQLLQLQYPAAPHRMLHIANHQLQIDTPRPRAVAATSLPFMRASQATLLEPTWAAQQQTYATEPQGGTALEPQYSYAPQPAMLDPTLDWQPALPLSVKTLPLPGQPQAAPEKLGTSKGASGASVPLRKRDANRSLILKLKMPKGHAKAKAKTTATKTAPARKRKVDDTDDDEEFHLGRETEKKMRTQEPVTAPPTRGARTKGVAEAAKRKQEFEEAVDTIAADEAQQDENYWGTSIKKRAPAKTRTGKQEVNHLKSNIYRLRIAGKERK